MKRASWSVALIVLLALAGGVAAQDDPTPPVNPVFASLYLQSGFELDPYLVRVASSGTLDPTSDGEGCLGAIPDVPDVVVNWTGVTPQLTFFVYSDVDPVLLVVTPSGEGLCNDDFDDATLNPAISVDAPAEGAYSLYIRAYSPDQPVYGWLGVTQVAAEALDLAHADLTPMLTLRAPASGVELIPRPATDLLAGDAPIFGAVMLDAGFGAFETPVTGAGVEAAPLFALAENACAGYINLAPSFGFSLTSDAEALSVLFNGETDSVLIVRRPDGSFTCSADATAENLNPALLLEGATAGDYYVWVGTMTPETVSPGTLVISEDAAAQPDLLAAGQ